MTILDHAPDTTRAAVAATEAEGGPALIVLAAAALDRAGELDPAAREACADLAGQALDLALAVRSGAV